MQKPGAIKRARGGLLTALVSGAVGFLAFATVSRPTPPPENRALLRGIVQRDETWVKVHAAEALLAGGDTAWVRGEFLPLVEGANRRIYRVGIFRVLAESAESAADRERQISAVEKVFLDRSAPDRSQAIETLDKLKVRLNGALVLAVREEAAHRGPPLQPLSLWALAQQGEVAALEQLLALLGDENEIARLDAAYALRWLRPENMAARVAVAAASQREPLGSKAYPYILAATFVAPVDASHARDSRAKLVQLVRDGSSAAKFEAVQALLTSPASVDREIFRALLNNADPDTQIAGAWGLWHLEKNGAP